MGQTAKGVPYPDSTDAPDGPGGIKGVADWVDARPGTSALTYAQINALTGEDLWQGRAVYQIGGGANRPFEGLYTYNGVSWRLSWTEPWGYIGSTLYTTSGGTYGAFTDIGLAVAFATPANRLIKATLDVPFESSIAGGGCQLQLLDESDTVQQRRTFWLGGAALNSDEGTASFVIRRSPPAGSHTWRAQLAHVTSVGGTVSTAADGTHPGLLMLEDIGPNGGPS